MSSPAPKSPEQTEKSKKYDRQLRYQTSLFNNKHCNKFLYYRLWGDHGQKRLENAKVCLINANALGTEILKNLILPGIGAFTVVDSEKVTEEDIGSKYLI